MNARIIPANASNSLDKRYRTKYHLSMIENLDCITDAIRQNKSGVCIIISKKKPFLSDKKFMQKFGFEIVDTIGNEYELLALSFDGSKPEFAANAKKQAIANDMLTVYYGLQCPYIPN